MYTMGASLQGIGSSPNQLYWTVRLGTDQIWYQLISDDPYGFTTRVDDALKVQRRRQGLQGLQKEGLWQNQPLLAAESTTADRGGLGTSCSSPLSTTERRTAYFSPHRQSTPRLGYPGRPVSGPTPRGVPLTPLILLWGGFGSFPWLGLQVWMEFPTLIRGVPSSATALAAGSLFQATPFGPCGRS